MRLDLRLFEKLLVIAFALHVGLGAAWAQEAGGLQITELAATVLPTVVEAPVQFGLLQVTVAAGESARYAVPEGMVYQLSGSQVVAWGGDRVTLRPGGGTYLGASSEATFSAGAEEDAVFLHFLLSPVGETGTPAVTGAAAVDEVHWSSVPLAGLEAGPYAFDLTLLEFGPHYPVNAPHYRSGGALYYVLEGAGAFSAEGVTQRMPTGSAILEPFALVHRWANPYDDVAIVVLANISPEGEPAVVFVD